MKHVVLALTGLLLAPLAQVQAVNAWIVIAILLLPPIALSAAPEVLPTPQRLTDLGGHVELAGPALRACILVARPDQPAFQAAVAEINGAVARLGGAKLPVVRRPQEAEAFRVWVCLGTRADLTSWKQRGLQEAIPEQAAVKEASRPDGYVLRCTSAGKRQIILALGHDDRGCYYAAATLGQLLTKEGDRTGLDRVQIVDWPTYKIRLIKNGAEGGDPAQFERMARLLPRYKLNVYALQYHEEKDGTWREPSPRFVGNVKAAAATARELGVLETGLYLCPFFPPRMVMTNEADIQAYIKQLKWGIELGCRWIEVDFNDWGNWRYLSAEERTKFGNLGPYLTYLVDRVYRAVRPAHPNVGIIVCPSQDYYKEPPKPELVEFCRSIPDDVLVYWTGPRTRSRVILPEEIDEWITKTGRKPLLWDNTIYARFQPYWDSKLVDTNGYLLNAYGNFFPENMPELLAGIHLNCSTEVIYQPGILTFADYLWNPQAYDADRSLRRAIALCWGREAVEPALEVQQRVLELAKWIYEAERGYTAYDDGRAKQVRQQAEEAAARLGRAAENKELAGQLKTRILEPLDNRMASFRPAAKLVARPAGALEHPITKTTINPSVEEIRDGKPVGWSLERSGGSATMSISDDAHSGRHSLLLDATEWFHEPNNPRHGDRKYISLALLHGTEREGNSGEDAYRVEGDRRYQCTFWLKSTAPLVSIRFMGWRPGQEDQEGTKLRGYPPLIQATNEWKQYTATFYTQSYSSRAAVMFGLYGYEDEGIRLGKIWVDDVRVEAVAQAHRTDSHD